MSTTAPQRFAHETLLRAVFADGLALTRAIAGGEGAAMLAALWGQAGNAAATAFPASVTRRGRYAIAVIAPPAPRESGDPAVIVIVGRGDGTTSLATIGYYVLELELNARTGAPTFGIVARTGLGARAASWAEGPLPDLAWVADHAFALYSGHAPQAPSGIPELPSWYWWFALGGARAVRAFGAASDDAGRFEAVRAEPILVMPEIIDSAEMFLGPEGAAFANHMRGLRSYLRSGTRFAPVWQGVVERLASENIGSAPANALRALPLVFEAAQHGALDYARANDLEANVRIRLAMLGVDPEANHARANELHAAARRPRLARGSVAPEIAGEDPLWAPLFLDETDLPAHARGDREESFSSVEQSFVNHGGLRAGFAVWTAGDDSALAKLVETRWVFRTANAAAGFVRAYSSALGDFLPELPAPSIGDDTLAFGDDIAALSGRRTHVILVRVGRVVARLSATEGARASASRQVLHAAMLHPLAAKIAQRARAGLAAYWLNVAAPTNAVPALFHSRGYDAAQLLRKYPLLALAELPSSMVALGDDYIAVARALASFQAQVRAHRWPTYRESMLALVRALLASDMGDPRVNASSACEIVHELWRLDPDPVWAQLDAECRARM